MTGRARRGRGKGARQITRQIGSGSAARLISSMTRVPTYASPPSHSASRRAAAAVAARIRRFAERIEFVGQIEVHRNSFSGSRQQAEQQSRERETMRSGSCVESSASLSGRSVFIGVSRVARWNVFHRSLKDADCALAARAPTSSGNLLTLRPRPLRAAGATVSCDIDKENRMPRHIAIVEDEP